MRGHVWRRRPPRARSRDRGGPQLIPGPRRGAMRGPGVASVLAGAPARTGTRARAAGRARARTAGPAPIAARARTAGPARAVGRRAEPARVVATGAGPVRAAALRAGRARVRVPAPDVEAAALVQAPGEAPRSVGAPRPAATSIAGRGTHAACPPRVRRSAGGAGRLSVCRSCRPRPGVRRRTRARPRGPRSRTGAGTRCRTRRRSARSRSGPTSRRSRQTAHRRSLPPSPAWPPAPRCRSRGVARRHRGRRRSGTE